MRRARARLAASALMLAACACVCAAQEAPAGRELPATTSSPPPSQQRAGGDANEDFELDIAERRITEADFYASTAVGVSAGALRLGVGVALGAERIDALLKNVRGRVRFRGSLEALRRVLDAHRGATPAADPARRDVP